MRRSAASLAIDALRIVIAVGVVIACVVWPVVSYHHTGAVSAADDPVTIQSYDASFTVDSAGTLHAVETITAQFPYGRHGIYRYFDTSAPWDTHARLYPTNIAVTRDGQPDVTDLSWENARHYRVVRIGDPDSYVAPGPHVYVISYDISGALDPQSNGASRFYWNVVAGGWEMPMETTTSVVSLPSAISGDIQCAVGNGASGGGCSVTSQSKGFTVTADQLGPRTPVTVSATMPSFAAKSSRLLWPASWDGVLGTTVAGFAAIVVLTVLLLLLAYWWEIRSREKSPGFPVQYAPPDKLGPVQAYYIAEEALPSAALVATITHEVDRGLLALEQREQGVWVIKTLQHATEVDYVDPVSAALVQALGLTTVGAEFVADGSAGAGKSLKSLSRVMNGAASRWATSSGFMIAKGGEHAGKITVVVAAIVFALLLWFKPDDETLWTFPFAAFVIGGLGLLRKGVGTRRTAAGRQQWAQAGGFYRLLSTPSSEDRFDFAAKKDLYISFIPYAIAFGCADEWAKKYQVNTGQEPPMPLWFGPMYVGAWGGWGSANDPLSSFQSSITSSIGAYSAAQARSVAGRGGGFVGGGGGGGGGGGAW